MGVQWQYKYLQISNDRRGFVRRLNDALNELGKQGWEFTGHVITADAWDYYFLKRQTPPPPIIYLPPERNLGPIARFFARGG